MTQLLALSVDGPISPSLRLHGLEKPGPRRDVPLGWGMGWYPNQGLAAMVVKDPTSVGQNAMSQVLTDWERFSSTLFVAHLRGAAKRTAQQDTHPFVRTLGGRDWLLAHNGDLRRDYSQKLPLPDDSLFQPIGQTDSEHLFCWLLAQIHAEGARRIAGVPQARWVAWLHRINELGTLNLLLSDGTDLLVYGDVHGYRPLHWIRRVPPNPWTRFAGPQADIVLGTPLEANRHAILVSTATTDEEGWQRVEPGQAMVARLGAVLWKSPAPGGDTADARPLAPEVLRAGRARDEELEDFGDNDYVTRILETVHTTRYTYEKAVEHSAHTLRLRPLSDSAQQLLSWDLEMTPEGRWHEFEDVFGNAAADVVFSKAWKTMEIVSRSVVCLRVPRRPQLRTAGPMRLPHVWMPWQRQMMEPYLLPPELPESQLRELGNYAMSFAQREDHDLVETLKSINQALFHEYEYVNASTTLETTPFEVFTRRKGVCQDFANLFIVLCRLLNLPARYRVGYIFTGNQYNHPEQGDASHAWAEVYIPKVGWRGFDPTNGVLVGLDHVRVACGRNFRDATPTAGTLFGGGGRESLSVKVQMFDRTGE
jgi:transglutaminase-like putative cysteine protease/predicted glutamine amidotransferase